MEERARASLGVLSGLGFGIGGFHHTDGAPVVHQCEKISPVIFSDNVGSLREL